MVNTVQVSFVMNHMPVLNTFSLMVADSKMLGINFNFSLMSLPLGGENNPVALAKAVGLLVTLAKASKLVSHMQLQPIPLAYILQTQFLPKKLD